jgi:NADPH:quinone reductase-like Zn-dependent oxidoreductase
VKAIVCHQYGPPEALRYENVEKPSPAEHQVLIRVRAASVNPLDWHLMRGTPALARLMFGLRKPKVTRPGHDVAGQVESVGANVTQFKPGDEVFGACRGSLAEYACASESALAIKPARVSFEQAAAVPIAGLTALQGLRGRLQTGQKVLINGAAGGVGTFAVQIAKSFGAEVTGVCGTSNMEMVRSIGADRVVDYTREDFTRNGQVFDLMYDLVGNHSFPTSRRLLHPKGIWVAAGIGGSDGRDGGRRLAGVLLGLLSSPFTSQRLVFYVAKLKQEDLIVLRDLMEAGIVRSVIDTCYLLHETSWAIRHLAEGHARGKIVVTVPPDTMPR